MISLPRRELFQLLSLSGGGYKGVFTLEVLKAIEQQRFRFESPSGLVHGRIQDCCDGFVGTSVGAIIAAGLAIGKSPSELLEIFHENGDKIFPGVPGPGYISSRYAKKHLEGLLRGIFGDRTFSELERPCYVSAVDAETGNTLLIGGYKGSSLHYENTEIWQAVQASVSAPTYFPFQKYGFTQGDKENEGSSGWLVDGGISANAPELLAAADLSKNFGVPLSDFFVLSVGTTDHAVDLEAPSRIRTREGHVPPRVQRLARWGRDMYLRTLKSKDSTRWGAIAWFINGRINLVELILRSQVNVAVRICENLIPPKQYVRVDLSLSSADRVEFDDPAKHETLCRLGQEMAGALFARGSSQAYRVGLFVNRKNTSHSSLDFLMKSAA